MDSKTELKFERETCGRCGGSGHYSYCSQHGTTCFGCGGSGVRYSKRAQAAIAWMKEQRTHRAETVQVGDRVKFSGMRGFSKVTEIRQSGSYSLVNGTERRYYTDIVTEACSYGVFPETPVEVASKTEEQRLDLLRRAIELQDSLTKSGKPRKASKA